MNIVERIEYYEVVILGVGFGGFGMVVCMKIVGIDDFVVFEKCLEFGGVWFDNLYFGVVCDIELYLYCYSFYLYLCVSVMYVGRNELFNYLKLFVMWFGLVEYFWFNCEICSVEWDVVVCFWWFELNDGLWLIVCFFVLVWG